MHSSHAQSRNVSVILPPAEQRPGIIIMSTILFLQKNDNSCPMPSTTRTIYGHLPLPVINFSDGL
ncbi:hypothetical protein SCLCIDRAFT_272338 [Scleroderma citrinum Foug A]|uniref:Uncharacterized protein n=1 Tax=Scleroderma citrinum Foug A TaxID=1036808 RepID=A0A0C2ZU03_9AGAM|nr:hypothetical protein SCLCIDRAFT_272338 [Scleroderma citrinum Foug A]